MEESLPVLAGFLHGAAPAAGPGGAADHHTRHAALKALRRVPLAAAEALLWGAYANATTPPHLRVAAAKVIVGRDDDHAHRSAPLGSLL